MDFGLWAHAPKTQDLRIKTSRRAFTLIELLVAITIIGILAGLALGGMYRANVAARQTNSKTTVNRVSAQIQEIWDSYRTRKLPIQPTQILSNTGATNFPVQYSGALLWLQYFNTIRTSAPYGMPANNPKTGQPYLYPFNLAVAPNNLQLAAIRLAATRELMRLEMPSTFNDFLTPAKTNPPDPDPANNSTPVKTLLIPQPLTASGQPWANPGGLSEQYRQFFIAHATTYNEQYQNAECLYMIIKFASQNELGQKNLTDDPRLIGDADGDGMPEIQDAFNSGTFTQPQAGSPYSQHNNPISFLRWPAGFLSDLQPGPNAGQTPVDYAAARHDIFDPLRIDPRAFTLTPLVYSAGVNTSYGLTDLWVLYTKPTWPKVTADLLHLNDPYYYDTSATPAVQPLGTPITPPGEWADNITNHTLSTRSE